MEKTTIQISINTLKRLKMLKSFERQSYDEVLNNLVDSSEEETLTEKEIQEIQEGLDNIKKGKVYSIENVTKELRVILN